MEACTVDDKEKRSKNRTLHGGVSMGDRDVMLAFRQVGSEPG